MVSRFGSVGATTEYRCVSVCLERKQLNTRGYRIQLIPSEDDMFENHAHL